MKFDRLRLVTRRARLNMTQESLAAEAKVSLRSVAAWEAGTQLPTLRMVNKLADDLNVSADWLLGGDHMHGPMLWDDLRAMLESGTVGVDAQWCREGETEFRPLSDLMALAATAPVAAPPAIIPVFQFAPQAAMAPPPLVVHVHAPARSTTVAKVQAGAIATIAAVIAGPVVLSIVGSVLFALFVVLALMLSAGSSFGTSAGTQPAAEQPAGK